MKKKAVVVTLNVRYQKGEEELYPTYGWLYEQGYLFATRGEENFYVLTDPLPESTTLVEEVQDLKDLGYEVRYLAVDEEENLRIQDSY